MTSSQTRDPANVPKFVPHLVDSVRLDPVLRSDYEQLRELEHKADSNGVWRFGQQHLSPEDYVASLWRGVAANFIARSTTDPSPLGLVTLYNLDSGNMHAYMAAVGFEKRVRPRLQFMIAIARAIDYSFDSFPLTKLYFEVPAPNLPQFGSMVGRIMHEEARLRRHRFVRGEFVDQYILAIYANEWKQFHLSVGVEAQP